MGKLAETIRSMQWLFDRGDSRKVYVRELADNVAALEAELRRSVEESESNYHVADCDCVHCETYERQKALLALLDTPTTSTPPTEEPTP